MKVSRIFIYSHTELESASIRTINVVLHRNAQEETECQQPFYLSISSLKTHCSRKLTMGCDSKQISMSFELYVVTRKINAVRCH